MVDFDVCEDVYKYWPHGSLYHGSSLVLLVLGGSCCIAFVSILAFLHRQNTRARSDGFSEGKTSTLIFPLYTKILWLGALATLIDALSNLFVPTNDDGTNSALNSFLFGGVWAIYHFVFEGVALLMLNDGVGSVAAKKSALQAGVWAAFTWVVQGWITFQDGNTIALALSVFWAAVLVCFYGALWLLPISVLFRRPCVFSYARFWCLIRAYICLANVLRHFGVTFGFCLYLAGTSFFQSPVVAFVVYTCLLRDCKYWLGILTWEASSWDGDVVPPSARSPTGTTVAHESLRRPLLGTSLGAHSARMLASKMDSNKPQNPLADWDGSGGGGGSSSSHRRRKGIKILNFAFLHIDQPVNPGGGVSTQQQQVVLGSGSSCRVFQGTFRDRPVAIKMIFCPELTPDTVVNFYHEATLLAQLQHVNVVEVLGVCVLPPSICLVMELCEGGNLYDFLRLPQQKAAPLTLWRQLSLAWDCCSAVQFLHTHTPAVLHLDLKSLNFLLTREGRVKVADLELSREIIISSSSSSDDEKTASGAGGSVVSGSELTGFKVPETLYWLAPEIILGQPYNEKADIYSLALVVWEIFTASVPYRSLEDSLILAARNAKYLEANGFAPGQYPVAPGDMPYSLEQGLPLHAARHRILSMDGSVDGYASVAASGQSSRRGSSSTVASANIHAFGGARPRTQSTVSSASSGANVHAPVALAPTPRSGRRSASASGRYPQEGEEEAEMSTPSSAGSSRGPSEAPSPSLNHPRNGYFLGGPSYAASPSPPPLSDLPGPQPVAVLPASTSGVSLLTHENLSTHASFTSSLPFPSRSAIFAPVETDPVLIEWKRMHHHVHQDHHPAAQHPDSVHTQHSNSFLPDFASAPPHSAVPPGGQKRPSYSRPTLPPIPASVSSVAIHLYEGTVPNSMQPAASEDLYAAVEESASLDTVSDTAVSRTSSASDGSMHAPLMARSAPFRSDLSPILASLHSTPQTGPISRSDATTILPPAVTLASPSSSSLAHSSLPRSCETYVQYDAHQPTLLHHQQREHQQQEALAAESDSRLWSGLASDDESSFEPTAFYPSTMPARSILAAARPLSPASATSSTHSRLVGPPSGVSSPALSATGSERVPRVTRLMLDPAGKSSRATKRSSNGRSSSSKKKKASGGPSSWSSSSSVKWSSVFVARSDVQAQLRQLICVDHYRPTIPPDMPDALSSLLTRAWHPVPQMRPTASEFTATIASLVDELKQQTTRTADDAHPFQGERREESRTSQQG